MQCVVWLLSFNCANHYCNTYFTVAQEGLNVLSCHINIQCRSIISMCWLYNEIKSTKQWWWYMYIMKEEEYDMFWFFKSICKICLCTDVNRCFYASQHYMRNSAIVTLVPSSVLWSKPRDLGSNVCNDFTIFVC